MSNYFYEFDEKEQTITHLLQTPNGYGVVVDQRFDTRELLAKWTNVELKRDDLVCVEWAKNYYLTVDLNNTHPNTYPFESEDE